METRSVIVAYAEGRAYSVQVERMRSSCGTGRQTQLNDRVRRQGVHASGWKEILRGLSATKDLKQNRYGWWDECDTIDLELQAGAVLRNDL